MAGVARPHARPAAAVLVHQAARVADVPVLVHVVGAVLREAAHDLRTVFATELASVAELQSVQRDVAQRLCRLRRQSQ